MYSVRLRKRWYKLAFLLKLHFGTSTICTCHASHCGFMSMMHLPFSFHTTHVLTSTIVLDDSRDLNYTYTLFVSEDVFMSKCMSVIYCGFGLLEGEIVVANGVRFFLSALLWMTMQLERRLPHTYDLR